MRLDIRQQPSTIALEQIDTSANNLKIARFNIHLILRADIILGTNMHIPHRRQRDPRHRIIIMRDPVVSPSLIADVRADSSTTNSRTTKRIQRDGETEIAELGGGEGSDGAAERVSCYGYGVGRVLLDGIFHGWDDGISRVDPGLVEAGVRTASVTDVGVCEPKVEIREPVI